MKIVQLKGPTWIGSVIRMDADTEAVKADGVVYKVKIKSRNGLGSGLPHEALFEVIGKR